MRFKHASMAAGVERHESMLCIYGNSSCYIIQAFPFQLAAAAGMLPYFVLEDEVTCSDVS